MRINFFCQLAAVTVLAFGFTPGVSQCHAASYIWSGGSGDWSDAGNWSPNGVPGPDDAATIDGGIVTVSTATTVSNLNMNGGIIAGSAVLSVVSNFTWTAGTMSGSGRTRLLASCTGMLSGGSKYLQEGRRLENAGNTTWQDGEIIVGLGSGGDSGYLINLTGGVFDVTVDGHNFRDKDNSNCPNPNTAIMENYGTLRRSSGNGVATLGLHQCERSVTGLINYGTIDVQTGTLILEASGFTVTDSGSYAVAAGATLGFSGNGTRNINTDLNLAGDIVVYGSTVNLAGDLSAHDISVNGGALTVTDQAAVRNVSISSTFGGTLIFNGTGFVTNLTLAGGALGGSGLINVASNFTWTGGTMTGNGTTRLLEHCVGILTGSNSKYLQGGRRWENGGVTTWQDGEIIVGSGPGGDSGTFVNLEDGLFEVTVEGHNFRDKENSNCPNPNTTVIINQGMLRRTGSGAVTLGLPQCGSSIVLVNNVGSVDVQSGTLVLGVGPGTANDTGSFAAATGATLGFAGNGTRNISTALNLEGHLSVSGSAVNVSGGLSAPTLNLSGGSLTVQGQAAIGSASVTMANGGGTLNFDGPGTITNLMFTGGTLGGTGLMNVVSNFTWTAGAMSDSGTTRLLEHCVGTLSGSGSKFLQGGRRWENDGTTTWQDGEIIVGSGPGGDSGTFVNLARGVFDITVESHNFRDNNGNCNNPITTVIVNEGTLRRSGGNGSVTLGLRSCNLSSSSMSNAGRIESQSGTLGFGGSFVQTGGATHLDGGNVAAGLLLIQGGTLSGTGAITGNVTSSGIVSPGASPGLLTISGNYTQSTAGTLNIEINGTDPGTGFDRLAVNGTASLNGTNNIFIAGGFAAPSGTKLKFLTAGALFGSFSRFDYELDYGFLRLNYQRSGASKFVEVEVIFPPLEINPLNASVPHGGTQTFTASGGIPPYAFSFVVNNSGGNIAGNGIYTAGSIARVSDTVKVTDLLGNNATASISVLPDHYRVLGRVADASANAIETATVTILSPINLTASTDAGGFYSFEQVPRGANITVSVSKAGYTFSPNQSFLVDNDKSADFTGTVLLRSISCIVTNSNGQGVKDVRISILRNSTTVASPLTDANGQVTVNNLPAVGTYQVVPSKLNATFSPTTRLMSLLQANAIASYRITESFIISGQITDSLGKKVADASVRFQNIASTKGSSAAKTGVNGSYKSRALAPGTYEVRPSKPGWVFNPPTRIVPIVNADVPGQDFTASKALISISGRITNLFGASFDDVTVTLTGGTSLTTTTTGDGSYVFQVPGIGTYNITPSKAGLIFQPPSVAITPSGLNVTQSFRGVTSAPLQHTRIVAIPQRGGRLMAMNGDGSDKVMLPVPSTIFVTSPNLSRDGLKIVFYVSDLLDNMFFTMNADGSGAKGFDPDSSFCLGPTWSPDGSRLAFLQWGLGAEMVLKIMNLAGNQPAETVRVVEYPASPFSWSPDGTQLIGRVGSRILRIPTNGTGATTITSTIGYAGNALSPDGSKVAFVDYVSQHWQIFVVNSDGTGMQQLTFLDGSASTPTWSPDGSMIAFGFNDKPGGSINLYTMMADGSRQTPIADALDPTWGPEPTIATSPGSNVTVTNGAATVTFSSVSSPGTTTVVPTPPATLGNLPPGYVSISGGGMDYEISTTASVNGPIQICFTVPGINDAAIFDSLRVFHGENGVLVDRTIRSPNSPAPDFSTRTICALVPSLSPFTIAMEIDTNLSIVTGVVVDESGNPIPDVTLELGPTNMLQTITSIAGQFAFANLEVGSNYTVVPLDDRYDFTPPLAVLDEVAGTNLIAFIAVPKPDPNKIFDVALEGGVLNFSFVSAVGKTHTIQYNDSLTSTNWLPLTNIIGDGLIWNVSDPLVPAYTQRYYRLWTH